MPEIIKELATNMLTKINALFSIADHPTPKINRGGQAYTLESRDYKNAQCVVLENQPTDSRIKILKDVVQTLTGRMGTGGGNTPMVMQSSEPIYLESNEDKASIKTDGISNSLTASMGEGSGHIPMITGSPEEQSPYENMIVRRLTPLECERLQGYPTVRTVKVTDMTNDEYIAWNLAEGHIKVDAERGIIYGTRGPGGIMLSEPKELQGTIINGYKAISIRNNNVKIACRAHRIIWIATHGIIPEGYVIDHINNDKLDNRIANLQLLTPTENSKKARADGLYKIREEAGQAKITNEIHDLIQLLYETTNTTCVKLAEQFGISRSRVQQIIHDKPWLDIGEWTDSNGKLHKDSDAPKYKAAGNSIALPFWQWLMDRIAKQLKKDGVESPTMASLFSGIGGFELCSVRAGIKPLWNSEIEEYPIAVTKKHFGDGENDNGDIDKFM